MKQFLVSLVLVLISSCVQPSPWYIEPEDLEASKQGCERACAHMRTLSCTQAKDLEDGTTCEEFCFQTERQGLGLNTKCIEQIKTCDEINTCTSGN
jgi:hypothetical protein